jgi:hypothetical protein
MTAYDRNGSGATATTAVAGGAAATPAEAAAAVQPVEKMEGTTRGRMELEAHSLPAQKEANIRIIQASASLSKRAGE